MNKRLQKRVLNWWDNLDIQEKDEYFQTVLPKSKSRYTSPTELEKEKMYNWAKA